MAYGARLGAIALAFGLIGGFAACGDDGSSGQTSGTGGNATGGAGGSSGGQGGTTTVTSSATTTGPGGSGGVIQCSDEYTNIAAGECDLLQQDCPAGHTCTPTPGDAGLLTTSCVPANGLKALGDQCTNSSECQAGLFCVVDRCSPVCCNGPGDVPCMGGSCNLRLTFQDDPEQYAWTCTYPPPCEPLVADACPVGQQCHLESEGVTSCFPPSGANAMEGEACTFINDCQSMQVCDPDNLCRWMCWTDDQGSAPGLGGCPAMQTCAAFNLGIPNLGICQP